MKKYIEECLIYLEVYIQLIHRRIYTTATKIYTTATNFTYIKIKKLQCTSKYENKTFLNPFSIRN